MLIKWNLSKILSKILASKVLIVRMESKISKIFESLTLWLEGWKRMVWRLETHGLKAGNAWFGGWKRVVGRAKCGSWLCEVWQLAARKWHFEGAKVAL